MSYVPRCGDVVYHGPTDEELVVAWAENGEFAPTGWPFGIMRLENCQVIERVSEEEHANAVKEWQRSPERDPDGRRAKVLKLYGDALASATTDKIPDRDDDREWDGAGGDTEI